MPFSYGKLFSSRLLFVTLLIPLLTAPNLWMCTSVCMGQVDKIPHIQVKTERRDAPYVRFLAAATYDSQRRRMIVFGGRQPNNEATSNQLLALDSQRFEWSSIVTKGVSPTGTGAPSMVYVDGEDAVYLFGGWPLGGDQPVGELWRLQFVDEKARDWELLTPVGQSPHARNGSVMVHDKAANRFVMHGGDSWSDPDVGFKPMDDLWEYDLAKNTWRLLKPTGEVPSVRWNHAAAIDPKARKMYLLGGAGYADGQSIVDLHLYELDLSKHVWRRLPVEGDIPIPLEGHSLTYDAGTHALLLAGGLSLADSGTAGPTELWTLDLASSEWSKTEDQLRETRRGHVAVFDPHGRRHILFGGNTATQRKNFYKKGKPLTNIVTIQLNK